MRTSLTLMFAMYGWVASALAAPVGTGFTYQGQIKQGGVPVSDECDFEFSLWDDPLATLPANQVGGPITFDGTFEPFPPIEVVNGLFQVELDFGSNVYNGDGRWLQIDVCCSSPCAPTLVTLTPRQPLTATPYAVHTRGLFVDDVGNVGIGTVAPSVTLQVNGSIIAGNLANSISPGVVGGTISGNVASGSNNSTVGGGLNNTASGRLSTIAGGDENIASGLRSTVGGGRRNDASGELSTVAGGFINSALDDYSTVGGGQNNTASANNSTIAGGSSNAASGVNSTIGGGFINVASAALSTVAGGRLNTASGTDSTVGGGTTNTALGNGSTVGGGANNEATADNCTVGGGTSNVASSINSTVGGGDRNTALGTACTVGGGSLNQATGNFDTIAGGQFNSATNSNSTIGGGVSNTVSGAGGTVGGGRGNNALANDATVGGGFDNAAVGSRSTVPGGILNVAGGDYSFAAGRRAKANHVGTFVWADSDDNAQIGTDFISTGTDQFLIRAAGGVGIGTSTPANQLSVAGDANFTGNVGIGTISPTVPLQVNGSIIAGDLDNSISVGVVGGTISGGGLSGLENSVLDNSGTIAGGARNTAGSDDADPATAPFATVSGGFGNTASGGDSTVGGGSSNAASGSSSTVGGGLINKASGSSSTIGGGLGNDVKASYGTIAGGGQSTPGDPATANRVFDNYGAIGGGGNNTAGSDDAATTNATYATVGGGHENAASGGSSTVGGGIQNTAGGIHSTVGGGGGNIANSENSTVAGGRENTASSIDATVGGGEANTAAGVGATVPGGIANTASGDRSFAAGNRAKANHNGTFVWADSAAADFVSSGANQFLIRAAGGVGIGTRTPQGALQIGPTDTFNLVVRSDGSIEAFEDREPIAVVIGNNGGGAFIGDSLRVAGNVGIGTTSPSNPLTVETSGTDAGGVFGLGEVVARVRNTAAGTHTALSVDAPTGKDAILYLAENGSPEWDVRSDASSGAFQIRHHGTAITTPMVIAAGGNVGIGTSTPSGKLHVVGAPGNSAVILPDDSISAEETLNEPGLAAAVPGSFTHKGGFQIVASRTIDCPAPGYILALATTTIFDAGGPALGFTVIVGLSLQPDSVPQSVEQLQKVDARSTIFTIQTVFEVEAGQQTAYFIIRNPGSEESFSVFLPRITLIYLPTAYGVVSTPPPP